VRWRGCTRRSSCRNNSVCVEDKAARWKANSVCQHRPMVPWASRQETWMMQRLVQVLVRAHAVHRFPTG